MYRMENGKKKVDGPSSKEGDSVGVVLNSPLNEVVFISYKLEFEDTNNVAEYEALILGLKATNDMNIDFIFIFGDVELIIEKINNNFQIKNPSLIAYRNEVWDLVENFFLTFNITSVSRNYNQQVDSLAIETCNFKVP